MRSMDTAALAGADSMGSATALPITRPSSKSRREGVASFMSRSCFSNIVASCHYPRDLATLWGTIAVAVAFHNAIRPKRVPALSSLPLPPATAGSQKLASLHMRSSEWGVGFGSAPLFIAGAAASLFLLEIAMVRPSTNKEGRE